MPNSYRLGRKGAAKGKTTELKLPSFVCDEDGNETAEHNVCRVRLMDPVAMLNAGLLDGFDDLTAIAAEKMMEVDGKTVATPDAVKAIMADPSKLLAGMIMVDRLVEAVVVEPPVSRPIHREKNGKPKLDRDGKEIPLGPDERDDDTLYTDDVDLEDRMFILTWAVGGIKDTAQFRREYAGVLESVEDGPGLSPFTLGDTQTH
jgi:hypothetical protein